jgi:hypothetical protein
MRLVWLAVVGVLLLGSAAFAETSSAILGEQTAVDSAPRSLIRIEKETPAMVIIRNAGIGLGAGGLAGAGFILLSQGKIPADNIAFSNEAMLTGLVVGAISGAAMGYIEVKREKALEVSATPPLGEKIPAQVTARFHF